MWNGHNEVWALVQYNGPDASDIVIEPKDLIRLVENMSDEDKRLLREALGVSG